MGIWRHKTQNSKLKIVHSKQCTENSEPGTPTSKQELKTQHWKHKTWNSKLKIQNWEYWTRNNAKLETQNSKYNTWNTKLTTQNSEHNIQNSWHKVNGSTNGVGLELKWNGNDDGSWVQVKTETEDCRNYQKLKIFYNFQKIKCFCTISSAREARRDSFPNNHFSKNPKIVQNFGARSTPGIFFKNEFFKNQKIQSISAREARRENFLGRCMVILRNSEIPQARKIFQRCRPGDFSTNSPGGGGCRVKSWSILDLTSGGWV